MSKKLKVLYVEWEDHYSAHTNWKKEDETDFTSLICKSVGFLCFENDKHLVLALNSDGQESFSQHMLILKSCIRKRKVLNV